MTTDLDNSSAVNESAVSGEANASSPGNQTAATPEKPVKRKRNLAGMPDPDAEVISLSPKTLMAKNRFICEICNKGFQRDQNLQLHRRGHNLPWKLKQRTSKEIRKRVYVCPEPSCVHHDPTRALGDLTGIKKHFSRKHGEKNWKCDHCFRKYAVLSDWKAHLKICGTREYKCDCGTLFSRRDSFITHRAFCDAIAVERAKVQPEDEPIKKDETHNPQSIESAPQSTSTTSLPPASPPPPPQLVAGLTGSYNGSVFASLFASSTTSKTLQPQLHTSGFKDNNLIQPMTRPNPTPDLTIPLLSQESISLCLSTNQGSSIFSTTGQYAPPRQPAMSATALLQKAAQMGATASGASLLRGYGLDQDDPDGGSSIGLGLGVGFNGRAGLQELMMGNPSVYGPKHATLDFLGLGIAVNGGTSNGLSALMSSIGGSLDVTRAVSSFGRGGSGEFTGKDMGL